MSRVEALSVLDRQLLLQLGDRLRRLRLARGITAVDLADRVGVTRPTLRNVESGDPGTAIGTYLRVMSALGIGGELALLGSDALSPAPADSAAARSTRRAPVVDVRVRADSARHQLQDLQSLALHEEAVRLVKSQPELGERAIATVHRWIAAGDARSASLWLEWLAILEAGAWRKVLGRSRHAQQLRQASPLVALLPEAVRLDILEQVNELRQGVSLAGQTSSPA